MKIVSLEKHFSLIRSVGVILTSTNFDGWKFQTIMKVPDLYNYKIKVTEVNV